MATRKAKKKTAKKKTATKNTATKNTAKKTATKKTNAPASSKAAPPVADSWARIDRWFAAHQTFQPKLRPGANERTIADAEKKLGVRFPDDFRASLKIHDGQDADWNCHWFSGAEHFGTLAEIVACWTDDRGFFSASNDQGFDEDERVHLLRNHPKHIPIAGSPFWDYDRLLLDLAPGAKGAVGQIVHRRDIELICVANSFAALLARIAQEVERKGRVTLRE